MFSLEEVDKISLTELVENYNKMSTEQQVEFLRQYRQALIDDKKSKEVIAILTGQPTWVGGVDFGEDDKGVMTFEFIGDK